jgi:Flp pilus assembly protein TadG
MTHQSPRERKAAVAVEFAVVAPVLLAILLTVVELNRTLDSQNLLEVAAREGARFAAMDRSGMMAEGQSGNTKLVNDVKNYLVASGVPRDSISVAVKDADNPSLDFDIDDPANDLRLFEVQIAVDYSAVSMLPVSADQDYALAAKVVFRNGRVQLSD